MVLTNQLYKFQCLNNTSYFNGCWYYLHLVILLFTPSFITSAVCTFYISFFLNALFYALGPLFPRTTQTTMVNRINSLTHSFTYSYANPLIYKKAQYQMFYIYISIHFCCCNLVNQGPSNYVPMQSFFCAIKASDFFYPFQLPSIYDKYINKYIIYMQ